MFMSTWRLQLPYGSSIAPQNAPTSRPSRPRTKAMGGGGKVSIRWKGRLPWTTGSIFRTGTSIVLRKGSDPIRAVQMDVLETGFISTIIMRAVTHKEHQFGTTGKGSQFDRVWTCVIPSISQVSGRPDRHEGMRKVYVMIYCVSSRYVPVQ